MTRKFLRRCWTVWVPLLIVIVATIMVFMTGHKDIAWIVSYGGTVLVLLANLIYILLYDPMRRWK